MRLGIGTAQLGMDYGVTNARGRVSKAEVAGILERAAETGLRIIDTAAVYGDSEAVLGEVLGMHHPFRIVTKTLQLKAAAIGEREVSRVVEGFQRSLARLRQQEVYALLLHRPADLFVPGGERLLEALQSLKTEGRIHRIGASVTAAEEIDRLLSFGAIDLMQLPLSWLDQRLAATGHLTKLQLAGVEVHSRSPFLQGVLVTPPESLPRYFAALQPHLESCRARFERAGFGLVQAALAYPLAQPGVTAVVCGVTSLDQFETLLLGYSKVAPDFDWAPCAVSDSRWLDPWRWPAADPARRTAQ